MIKTALKALVGIWSLFWSLLLFIGCIKLPSGDPMAAEIVIVSLVLGGAPLLAFVPWKGRKALPAKTERPVRDASEEYAPQTPAHPQESASAAEANLAITEILQDAIKRADDKKDGRVTDWIATQTEFPSANAIPLSTLRAKVLELYGGLEGFRAFHREKLMVLIRNDARRSIGVERGLSIVDGIELEIKRSEAMEVIEAAKASRAELLQRVATIHDAIEMRRMFLASATNRFQIESTKGELDMLQAELIAVRTKLEGV